MTRMMHLRFRFAQELIATDARWGRCFRSYGGRNPRCSKNFNRRFGDDTNALWSSTWARFGVGKTANNYGASPDSNERRQTVFNKQGHSPSNPFIRAEKADGCGMVMIALNASGARWA